MNTPFLKKRRVRKHQHEFILDKTYIYLLSVGNLTVLIISTDSVLYIATIFKFSGDKVVFELLLPRSIVVRYESRYFVYLNITQEINAIAIVYLFFYCFKKIIRIMICSIII